MEKIEKVLESLGVQTESLASIIASLRLLITTVKDKIAQADELMKLAKEEQALWKKIEEELLVREKIVAEKEKGFIAGDELAKAKDALEAERAALDNAQQAFKRESAAKTSELDQKHADLNAVAKELKKDRAALDLEKATYKENLLAELKKKMER
jgi:multidrug resistance efflux pump